MERVVQRVSSPWTFVSIASSVQELISRLDQAGFAVTSVVRHHKSFRTERQVFCAGGKFSFFVQFRDDALVYVNQVDLGRWEALLDRCPAPSQEQSEPRAAFQPL